ncbi:MAG: hypothetical protein JXX28_06885 [Deltaproteobacteria bacterium]|nr:hypothetical protein [Deltaproteobacteria bacterium]
MRLYLPLLFALLSACTEGTAWAPHAETTRSTAPYSPTSGADLADRDCLVTLRQVARVSNGTGGYQVHQVDGQRYIVWEGSLDVAQEALDEGAVPAVIFHYGSSWWEVDAEAVDGAPAGAQRFAFWLDEHTPVEGMSTTSLAAARIELVPLLHTAEGDRLFDHNRNPGAFDNYTLSLENGWSVGEDDGACAPAGALPWSALTFEREWTEAQRGAISPGSELVIHYDPYRLTQCLGDTYMGRATWSTWAYGRFLPGGQRFSGSVIDCGGDPACATPAAAPLLLDVPEDAEAVELWFNTSGRSCGSTWDSNFGENYRFATSPRPAAPVWAGDVGYCLSRGMDQRVEPTPASLVIDSWVISRADTRYLDAEVYVPGLTDAGDDGALVLARAEVSRDGAPVITHWMDFRGRVDNNFRFAWSLFDEDMIYTPWDRFDVTLSFSTDGLSWVSAPQVALVRGEDWCPEGYWGADWCDPS